MNIRKVIKVWDKSSTGKKSQSASVYHSHGLFPCMSAGTHGYSMGLILLTGENLKNENENENESKGDTEMNQQERILKLASVDNKTRKEHIKLKTVPDVEINIESGKCIATRHLGRNGGLISDLASTIQVAEIPHITCNRKKEELMNKESQRLA